MSNQVLDSLFYYILGLEFNTDSSIIVDGKKISISRKDSLFVCASNIELVLHGARLGYRFHIPNARYILDDIIAHEPRLMILNIIKEEPLVILKTQETLVQDILAQCPDQNIFFAHVLGYGYIGSDWYECGYGLGFNIKLNGMDNWLYNFNVPKHQYTYDIQSKMLQTLALFQSILGIYDIEVSITYMDESYNFIDFDKLL